MRTNTIWNICWLFISLLFMSLFVGVALNMQTEYINIVFPTLVLMFFLFMLTYLVSMSINRKHEQQNSTNMEDNSHDCR
jgi:hypothetical protein